MTPLSLGITPGQLIRGQYRVEGLIGEGGYGAVYAATQIYAGLAQGRRVALKVLHPDVLLRASALARFSREAQLAQSLHHPNSVRLFDFGQTDNGLPFIVYELLHGKSLERVLVEQVRISARRTARVAAQTLKALMEAHGIGIVHRDIKPANLFLCDFAGETDFVKVLDYGIAASQSVDDSGPLTREGASIGTPAYMSPEQVLCEPVDGRADLYGLGLVMAEAISGTPVFQGRTGMQVAMQQVADTPVPLPDSVLGSPLGEVISRATQKPRDRRFGSAAEMLEAVERIASRMQMSLSGPEPAAATHLVLHTPGTSREESLTAIQEAPTTGMPIVEAPHRMGSAAPHASAGSPMSPAHEGAVPITMPSRHWSSHQPGPMTPGPVTPGPGAPEAAHDPRFAAGQRAQSASPPGPYGHAPATLSASYLPTRAPTSSKMGLVIALVVGGLLVLGGAALVGAYLFLAPGPTSQKSHTKASSKRGSKDVSVDSTGPKPVVNDALESFTIHGVPAQTIVDRMAKEGWHYEAMSEGDLGFGQQTIYTFDNDKDDVATLTFREKPKQGADLAVGIGYVVHDGPRSVELTIVEDSDESKPTLQRLLRKP